MDWPRRQVLRGMGATSLVVLGGCSGSDNPVTETDSSVTTTSEPETETDSSVTTASESVTWVQQSKLIPDDTKNAEFGYAVKLSSDGTTVLIGAWQFSYDDVLGSTGVGSAFVFSRNDEGWTQQARLIADDGDQDDLFGSAVTLSEDGSIALIGANGKGRAYIFTRRSEGWEQQTKLPSDGGNARNEFGYSVALSSDGSIAFVGAPGDEASPGPNSGSVYIFTQREGSWTQQTTLTPEDHEAGDRFGFSVELSDDRGAVLIGASGDPGGGNAGAAYVFEQSGDMWTQQAKLIPDDSESGDQFGTGALSSDGSIAVIGAHSDDNSTESVVGSAYVFTRSGGEWNQQTKLAASDGDSLDKFGTSVGLSDSGSVVLIGAPGDEGPNGQDGGSAYVFARHNGSWSQQAKFTSDDGQGGDFFGRSVDLSNEGATALVGAFNNATPLSERGSSELGRGAAYIFEST